jgi:hypothetical protein
MTNKIMLTKRRGFLRLAIETGATLVPVLADGESKVAPNMAIGCLFPARAMPVRVSPGLGRSAARGGRRWSQGAGAAPLPAACQLGTAPSPGGHFSHLITRLTARPTACTRRATPCRLFLGR